jgi:hypothetical protein
MVLEQMRNALEQLQQAFEEENAQKVQQAMDEVNRTFRLAWEKYQQGDISIQVRGQALPRTIYLFVTEELPAAVNNPTQWPDLRRKLSIIRRMIDLVVMPKEG